MPPSIGAQRFPIAKESLYALLAGQQALVKEGDGDDAGTCSTTSARLRAGPATAKDELLQSDVVEEAGAKGELPEGLADLRRAARDSRAQVRHRRGRLSGRQRREPDERLLLPDPLRPQREGDRGGQGRAGDDGRGPEARRHATGLRHDDRRADRDDAVHRLGRGQVRRDHRASRRSGASCSRARSAAARRSRSTSRSCSTARSSRGRRSTGSSTRTGSAARTAPRSRASAPCRRRRTSRSSSRPAPCPSPSPRSSRPPISATLGADSLEEAWQAAIAGLLVVALFLLVFYRVLGVVAVIGLAIYAAFLVRGDPALQRHADAAGLRRDDPDAGRRRRREHRHLRTR